MTWEAAPTGKRRRQAFYSKAAVQICLTMKVLCGVALRQADISAYPTREPKCLGTAMR